MIAVVIPTYNESENITNLLELIFKTDKLVQKVLVVDDSSSDGTIEEVRQLQKKFNIELLIRPRKSGLGSALMTGLQLAVSHGADAVITMDADLSHDPAILPTIVRAVNTFDLVIGSRYFTGGSSTAPKGRKWLSNLSNKGVRRLLGMPFFDLSSGFRCYSKEAISFLNTQHFNSNGYDYMIESLHSLWRAGFKISEVPINFPPRSRGNSKFNFLELAGFIKTTARLIKQEYVT